MAAAYRLGDNFLLKLEVSTTPGGFPVFFVEVSLFFHCLKLEIASSFTFFLELEFRHQKSGG